MTGAAYCEKQGRLWSRRGARDMLLCVDECGIVTRMHDDKTLRLARCDVERIEAGNGTC